jgi:hypothetical protein
MNLQKDFLFFESKSGINWLYFVIREMYTNLQLWELVRDWFGDQNVGWRRIMTVQSAGPAAGDHEDCSHMLCQLYFLFRLFLLSSPILEYLSGILSVFRYNRTPFPFLWSISHHSLIIIELLANSSENLVKFLPGCTLSHIRGPLLI